MLVNGDALSDNANGHNSITNEHKFSKAQRRLQQLEQVVTSLVHANTTSTQTEYQPTPQLTSSTTTNSQHESGPNATVETLANGRLEINGPEANYVGSTHWATILANVGSLLQMLRFY